MLHSETTPPQVTFLQFAADPTTRLSYRWFKVLLIAGRKTYGWVTWVAGGVCGQTFTTPVWRGGCHP